MSVDTKLDGAGNCGLCKKVSGLNEHLECRICKNNFHVVCASLESKIATKTTVSNFVLPSTKDNLLFLCDICLTQFEQNLAETENHRIKSLENKVDTFSSQLTEIKNLLSTKTNQSTTAPISLTTPRDSVWHDQGRLATVKAPPPSSVLVVPKTDDPNKDKELRTAMEKAILDNSINLHDSHTDKDGGLVLVCGSQESRDQLNTIVTENFQTVQTKTPKGKRPTITIVGLSRGYNAEEITDMIVKQNEFVKNFAVANNIHDHFKVLVVKPTKNDEQKFQVFAGVSSVLRDGIKQYNDKLTLGLSICKVYDQYHVKRCNKCQQFGHYSKHCTATVDVCGKCAGNHTTMSCSSVTKKCFNCHKNNFDNHEHYAYDAKCPSIIKQQENLKKQLDYLNESRIRRNAAP